MDLLYSTENHTQYLLKHKEKVIYVCMCVCVYIYLNHFAVHLKLIQYCKSTIYFQLKKVKILK